MTVMTQDEEQWKRRYNYLLSLLIERGVITNTRYDNGTWVIRGIYGIDDSGLMGAGRTPDEAIDNAILMSTMTPTEAEKHRQKIHKGFKVSVCIDASADSKDWCDKCQSKKPENCRYKK